QAFGHGSTREPGKLSQTANAERLELGGALPLEREQRERQRREELLEPLGGDDQHLARTRHGRGGQSSEAPLGRARARIPRQADRGERALQRRLEPAVEPLDAARLEEDGARFGGIDDEAGVLEPAQDLLPRLLGPGRIALDEDELRA